MSWGSPPIALRWPVGSEARAFTALIHKTQPQYRVDDFLAAFQFSLDAAALFQAHRDRLRRLCAKWPWSGRVQHFSPF
ncbi:MAG: hypothetical protein ACREJ5_14190 [Geminicoccaceae bacterium]